MLTGDRPLTLLRVGNTASLQSLLGTPSRTDDGKERSWVDIMAAEGGTRAVVTALGANLGVAVAKFVAAAITGSTSMLAEGVHSVADSGNQVLLLIGGKRARQAPSALHPFGYARARYIYAFLVAVVLFTLGGLYALYEGYHKIVDPHPLTSPLVAVAVLVIAVALEGFALRTAVREANRTGSRDWLGVVRRGRSPELPVLLLEDSGALVGLVLALLGVGLSVLTGNGVYDGISSICIGLLLARRNPAHPRDHQPAHRRGRPPRTDQQDSLRGSGNPR